MSPCRALWKMLPSISMEPCLDCDRFRSPEGTRQNMGAWYDLGGGLQLHLSIEDNVQNEASDRHVCYQVDDAASAALHFRNAGIEIIADGRPVKGPSRFFVRDPGGNMIEITEGKAG